jgi:hypothetical protein
VALVLAVLNRRALLPSCFLFIRIERGVGGENILGPLDTSATEWPIVPAPDDCNDGEFGGMKIGRGNHLTRQVLEPGQPRWEASD